MIRRIKRSSTDKKIFGVCGGLGEYLRVDPNFIRLIWILASLGTHGFVMVLYFIFAALMPKESDMNR